MFIYVLLLLELSVLLLAYYLLFVHEPSPYKVDEDVWGKYEGAVTPMKLKTKLVFKDNEGVVLKFEKPDHKRVS